jgi:hypothetical protein
MKIGREHVLEVLRTHGTPEQVRRADEVLGAHVDTEDDADLLRELGIDPDRRALGGGLAPAEGRGDEIGRS